VENDVEAHHVSLVQRVGMMHEEATNGPCRQKLQSSIITAAGIDT